MTERHREAPLRLRNFDQVINTIQINRGTHDRYLKAFKDIYEQTHEKFMEKFKAVLLYIFLRDCKAKNPYNVRTLEFLAKFCVFVQDEEGNNVFLSEIVNFILEFNNSPSHDVRYHICEFIKLVMTASAEMVNGVIDDDVCDQIIEAMKERINDIKPNIRNQAVLALLRLQDPSNIEDPVTKIYIKSMMIESSAIVRRSLILCMCSTSKTIQIILSSCLDKDETIQLAAFQKICKIPVYLLKIEQRQYVLRNGYNSKIQRIIQCVNEILLPKWIEHYEDNYLKLIKALQLDANEDDVKHTVTLVEILLKSLFKSNQKQIMLSTLKLTDEKLLPSDELTFECTIYWRCLLEYLHKEREEDGYEYLEKLMPDLSKFVSLIERFYETFQQSQNEWDFLMNNQILAELLQILLLYDMLDETGRKDCYRLVLNLLSKPKITTTNYGMLIKAFEKINTNIDERCIEICSLISNLREPMVVIEPTAEDLKKRDLKLAPLRVEINILTENLEDAVKLEEFVKASEMKQKIAECRDKMQVINDEFDNEFSVLTQKSASNDIEVISHCLDILIAFNEHDTQLTKLNDSLRVCLDQYIKPLLTDTISTLHIKVIHCLAYFCYIDKSLAEEYLQMYCSHLLIYRYIGTYVVNDIAICSRIITDLLIIYTVDLFGDKVDESTEKKKKTRSLYDNTQDVVIPDIATSNMVVEILTEMLDDSEPHLRETAGWCLIKLMMNQIIMSSVIFSKLTIKWFNPITKRDQYLSQLLGHFFENFIKLVPGSDEVIEAAFIPTLKTIANAPLNSPLIDINTDCLIKFLASISQLPSPNHSNVQCTHKNLLLMLGNEVLQLTTNIKEMQLYLKSLIILDLPYDDKIIMADLKKQAKDMLQHIQVKNQKKLIQKYMDRLNEIEIESEVNNETINETDTLTESLAQCTVSDSSKPDKQQRKRKRKEKIQPLQPVNDSIEVMDEDNMEIEESSPEIVIDLLLSDSENEETRRPVLRRSTRKNIRRS